MALGALALGLPALARVALGADAAVERGGPDTSAPVVVLLDAPSPLVRALRTALSPWGLRLESSSRTTPASSLPAAASSAQRLARELGARALVWISADADGAALWLYETSRDSVRVRAVPDRPLDDALAAALALSVKTWLRSAEEAPEPVSASAAPEPALDASGGPAQAPFEPDASPSDVEPARARPATGAARTRLVVHAEARVGALRPTGVQGRYALELRAAAWRDGATSLWLAAHVGAGQARAVRDAALRGDYTQWGGGVSAGVGQRLAATWFAYLLAGVALERATLSGTLLPDGSAIDRSRWQAVVQLRPELEFALAPVGFLLQPTLYAAPRQPRYLVDGVEVLGSRAVWWSLGGAVSVSLF